MVVLGDREIEARTASPRTRAGEQQPAEAWESFADRLAAEIGRPRRRLSAARLSPATCRTGLQGPVLGSIDAGASPRPTHAHVRSIVGFAPYAGGCLQTTGHRPEHLGGCRPWLHLAGAAVVTRGSARRWPRRPTRRRRAGSRLVAVSGAVCYRSASARHGHLRACRTNRNPQRTRGEPSAETCVSTR